MAGLLSKVAVCMALESNAGVGERNPRDVAGGVCWAMEKEEKEDISNKKSSSKWPKVELCFSDNSLKVAIMTGEAIRRLLRGRAKEVKGRGRCKNLRSVSKMNLIHRCSGFILERVDRERGVTPRGLSIRTKSILDYVIFTPSETSIAHRPSLPKA